MLRFSLSRVPKRYHLGRKNPNTKDMSVDEMWELLRKDSEEH